MWGSSMKKMNGREAKGEQNIQNQTWNHAAKLQTKIEGQKQVIGCIKGINSQK
jgi:hypothetical protein